MKYARQTGFTIIELVLVLVVMGVLAGLAIPSLTNRQSQDEISARDDVKSTLRTARMLAMAQGQRICFMRTVTDYVLVYANAAGACVLAGTRVKDPITNQDVVGSIPNGVILTGANAVQFSGRGQLIPSTTDQTITVGSTQFLTVNRETGFVY